MSINVCVKMTMFICLMFFYLMQKCKVSEMNEFLLFMQKFKMAAKNGEENNFLEKSPDTVDILGVKYRF